MLYNNMVNNFVGSNHEFSIDGSFSGINYGSWIEREKRLNQNKIRLDNMKWLKNTGLQFNFLTYHINNNYAEKLLNEIKEDYKTLSELNEIQEEHMSSFSEILNSELNDNLTLYNPARDTNIIEYKFIKNFVFYKNSVDADFTNNYYITQYTSRQISYEYYHNIFTNSHLHFNSLTKTGSISYNGIFQSYVPHILEYTEVNVISSVSTLSGVKGGRYTCTLLGENSNSTSEKLLIEFDDDLAYCAASTQKTHTPDIENTAYAIIDFYEDLKYCDFENETVLQDGYYFIRYLPIYGSLIKNFHRNFNYIINSTSEFDYIIHKCYTRTGESRVVSNKKINNTPPDIHIDSVNQGNLNCLRFSIKYNVMKSFAEDNELYYIESIFVGNGNNVLTIKWKPTCVPFEGNNIYQSHILLKYNQVIINENNESEKITETIDYDGELNVPGNSKLHINTFCSNNNVHYKISKIDIVQNEYKTNSLPKIFMTDKHSFDIYGIGDGKYELCVTFLGEHGEYKISNYKLNVVINEDFNKNSLKYNVENINTEDLSIKIRIKEEIEGAKIPDSINVAVSNKIKTNAINYNFIKDVKYINCDMYDYDENAPGYFASCIVYFDKEKLELITNSSNNENGITNQDIIDQILNGKYINIDVYCFYTNNGNEDYEIYNIYEEIKTSNLTVANISETTLNTALNKNSKLFETEKITNLLSSAKINWRLFNNDKRLYNINYVKLNNINSIILDYLEIDENQREMFKDISLVDLALNLNNKYENVELEFGLSKTDYILLTFDCELFNIIEGGKYVNRLLIYPNSIRLNGKLNGHQCIFVVDSKLKGINIDSQNNLVWDNNSYNDIETLTITAINNFTNKKFEIDLLTLPINNILSEITLENENEQLYQLSTNKKYSLSFTDSSEKLYLYYTNIQYSEVKSTQIYPYYYLGSRLFGSFTSNRVDEYNKILKYVWINLGPNLIEINGKTDLYYKWQQYDRNTGKFVDKIRYAFLLTKHPMYYNNINQANHDNFYYSDYGNGSLYWTLYTKQTESEQLNFDYWELGDTTLLPNNYILSPDNKLWNLDDFDKSGNLSITLYKPLNIFNNGTSNEFDPMSSFEIEITSEMINNVFDMTDGSINIYDYIIVSKNGNLSDVPQNAGILKSCKKVLNENKEKDFYININNSDFNLFFNDSINKYEIELKDILRKISNIPIYHFNDYLSNYPKDTQYDNLLHKKAFYGATELINSKTSFIKETNKSNLFTVNNRFWGISCNQETKYYAYSIPEVPFNSTMRSPHLHYVNEGNNIFNYFMLYSNISKLYKDFEWKKLNNNKDALFNSIKFSKFNLSENNLNDFIDKNVKTSETPIYKKYIGFEQDLSESGFDYNDIFYKVEIKHENILDLFFKNKNEYNDFWTKRINAYDELLNVLTYFDNYKELTPLEIANKLTMYLYPNNPVEAGFAEKDNGLNALRNRQLLKNETRYKIFTNNGKKSLYSNIENTKTWNKFLYSEIISKFIPTFHINENILEDISNYGLNCNIIIPSDENYGINNNGIIDIFSNTKNKLNKTSGRQYSYVYDKNKNVINISYSYEAYVKKTFYAKKSEPMYYLSSNKSYLGLSYYARYTIDNNGKIIPTSYLTYNKKTFSYTLNNSYLTVDSITNVISGITANNTLNDDISYYIVSSDGSYITKRGVELQQMLPECSYNAYAVEEQKYTYKAYTINKNGEISKYEFNYEIPNSHNLYDRDNDYVFGKSFYTYETITQLANNTENISEYGLYDYTFSYMIDSYTYTYIYNVIKKHNYRNIENAIKLQENLCEYLINEVEKTSLMLNIFEKSKQLLNTFNNNYIVKSVYLDRDYITVNSEILDVKLSYINTKNNEECHVIKQIYLPKNTYFSWKNNDIYAYTENIQIDDIDAWSINELNTYNGYLWHDFNNCYSFKYLKRSLYFNDVNLENNTKGLQKIHWDDILKLSVGGHYNRTNASLAYEPTIIAIVHNGKINEFNLTDKNYKYFTYTEINNNIEYKSYTYDAIRNFVLNGYIWDGYCFNFNQYINYGNNNDSLKNYIYYTPTKHSYYTENKSLISSTYTYELVFNNNLITLNIDLPPYTENEEKWKCDVEIGYLRNPNNILHTEESYIWITPHNKDFKPFGIWAYNIKDIDVEIQTNFANRNYLFDKDKYMYKFAYDFRYFQGPWAYTNADISNIGNYDNYETVKNHEYEFVSGLENTNYMLTSEHLYDPVAARVSSNYVSKINNYIFSENQPFEFYLGSINEWQLVSDNIQEISKKVLELNGDPLYDGQKKYNNPAYYLYWTSSEESTDCAWNIFLNECEFREQNKNSHLFVRPFFKIKNEIPTFTNVIFENTIKQIDLKLNFEKSYNETTNNFNETTNNFDRILNNFASLDDKFYMINIIYDSHNINNSIYGPKIGDELNGTVAELDDYKDIVFWKTQYEYIIDDITEISNIMIRYENDSYYNYNFYDKLPSLNNSELSGEFFAKTSKDNVIPGCSLAYILDVIRNNERILYSEVKPYKSSEEININFFTEFNKNTQNIIDFEDDNLSLSCLTILVISDKCRHKELARFAGMGRYQLQYNIISYAFGVDNKYDTNMYSWTNDTWEVSTEGKSVGNALKHYIDFKPISILVHNQQLTKKEKNFNYSYIEYSNISELQYAYLSYIIKKETEPLIKPLSPLDRNEDQSILIPNRPIVPS